MNIRVRRKALFVISKQSRRHPPASDNLTFSPIRCYPFNAFIKSLGKGYFVIKHPLQWLHVLCQNFHGGTNKKEAMRLTQKSLIFFLIRLKWEIYKGLTSFGSAPRLLPLINFIKLKFPRSLGKDRLLKRMDEYSFFMRQALRSWIILVLPDQFPAKNFSDGCFRQFFSEFDVRRNFKFRQGLLTTNP